MTHWEDRLRRLAGELGAPASRPLAGADRFDPHAIGRALEDAAGRRVIVTGTFERRLVFADSPGAGWLAADLSGEPHSSRDWPEWAGNLIRIADPGSWLSSAVLPAEALARLTRPRLLLAALYHPENFPLPRFPLGISDLARAARTALLGQVRMSDMQLGAQLGDIAGEALAWPADIVGVSATFGQHDLLTRLLDGLFAAARPPLVIVGGSLAARNERMLLERYPRLLVARGGGEATVQDVLSHWHGDRPLPAIRGIGYARAPGPELLPAPVLFRHTAAVGNRAGADIFPELDLLDRTLTGQGAAQLESSRGCTNYCSFCPRGHKGGSWAGTAPARLPWILDGMREVFDRHPEAARILYLVDEEFIGRGDDAVPRALAVATMLHERGFRWETSCRIDQVADPRRGRAWHEERAAMWRALAGLGLRRCLFGVESGVTTILDRFQKETTAEQNVLAVRTLSGLGIPTRFTYITFDQLMSHAELQATYDFMGREDILLRPQPHLSPAQIVTAVADDGFARENAAGCPFYHGISYMLVSMECLSGAAYTKRAEAAGLTRGQRPSMGRVDAEFLDPRIGRCSHHAQLWIDRNFALDYTLKSLEKRLDEAPHQTVRAARAVIKDSAHTLLGAMLGVLDRTGDVDSRLDSALLNRLELHRQDLRDRLAGVIPPAAAALPAGARTVLTQQYELWQAGTSWQLINAADPCGT